MRRWSRPTTCASSSRTSTRRTRRASASTTASVLADPAGRGATRAAVPASRRPRWRRCSPTCRRRSRTASRSRAAARCRWSSAALLPAFRFRTAADARQHLRDARRAEGSPRGIAAAEPPPAMPAPYRERLERELGGHLRHGLRGLLPDRRGLHPLGARERRFRSGPAAVPAPARWSPGRSASPTSIRCAHDLLFERFLNPERVSMPDFDIDFCMEAATASSTTSPSATGATASRRSSPSAPWRRKAVVRDVGRVLGRRYGFVDRDRQADPVRARHHARRGARARSRNSRGATAPRTRCAT